MVIQDVSEAKRVNEEPSKTKKNKKQGEKLS